MEKNEINKKIKKEKDFLLHGSSFIGRGFVLGNKVAGMFSYCVLFRGYALSIDEFCNCCLKICI